MVVTPSHADNIARLVRSLEAIARVSDEGRAALSELPLRVAKMGESDDLVREGDRPHEACLVLSGFVSRYKSAPGGQRQIVSFHLPGEIPDLHSLHLEVMDHGIAAMIPSTCAYIPHEAVRAVAKAHQDIADAFWRATLIDASIFRQWIANLGRRTAQQRLAHLFCEIFVRMQALGLADAKGFRLPLTQSELSDALGLSTVHVNRTLQELRRQGLIESNGRYHSVLDWPGLKQAAEFDPGYLHLREHVAHSLR